MKKRFTEEQIIRVLKEHAAGGNVGELCRRHGISQTTLYKWKAKFGGMEVSDAKKLRVHVGDQHGTDRRKEALKLVKQGRVAYNSKNDTQAEKLFRDAVAEDENCALAYAYLGNALYRQGRADEAELSWRRATMVEPASEGAEKALHSLQHLAKKKKAYMDRLDDKLRHGRSS